MDPVIVAPGKSQKSTPRDANDATGEPNKNEAESGEHSKMNFANPVVAKSEEQTNDVAENNRNSSEKKAPKQQQKRGTASEQNAETKDNSVEVFETIFGRLDSIFAIVGLKLYFNRLFQNCKTWTLLETKIR